MNGLRQYTRLRPLILTHNQTEARNRRTCGPARSTRPLHILLVVEVLLHVSYYSKLNLKAKTHCVVKISYSIAHTIQIFELKKYAFQLNVIPAPNFIIF